MNEAPVAETLFREPFRFDFFQAVRLLHLLHPDRAEVGGGGPPSAETVRLKSLPSLSFPPSQIHSLVAAASADMPPAMTVTFMGLVGVQSVLPRHYTEHIMRLEREAKGETRRALRDWLDLFNHRYLSLFHRAWRKYRFWAVQDTPQEMRRGDDPFTGVLRSVSGLLGGGLENRLRIRATEPDGRSSRTLAGVEDAALLYHAGLFAQRKRNAHGLEALLSGYFGVKAKVQQFVGQWLHLGDANRTRLGVVGGNATLGADTVVGGRVWDVQGKFRVRLLDLDYRTFLDFLPDRSATGENKAFFLLSNAVRLYAGAEFDFDVNLILRAEEVPECQLVEETPGPRLGWNTWLTSQQPQHAAEDALFGGEEVERIEEITV